MEDKAKKLNAKELEGVTGGFGFAEDKEFMDSHKPNGHQYSGMMKPELDCEWQGCKDYDPKKYLSPRQ